MGTTFRIVLHGAEEGTARAAADAAFARIAEIDARLSDYRGDSELNALCRGPVSQSKPVSHDLYSVLARARDVSQASDGAFDVTVGPLVRLWRRAKRLGKVPTEERRIKALEATSWHAVRLGGSKQEVALERPAMQLDLGGIAKGYAAQEALDLLARRGFESALIDAGGDIALGAPPPGRTGWRIALPGSVDEDGVPRQFTELSRRSIATSGDLYRYVSIDGVRYSHIVDPRTGLGLTERRVVTVIHPDGSLADALASALSVLGPAGGPKLEQAFPEMEWAIRTAAGEMLRSTGFPSVQERATSPESQ